MGNEISLLSSWTIEIWAQSMALGFCFPHDFLVKTQRYEFNFRPTNYAAKTKQKELISALDDLLGRTITKG